MNFVVLWDNSPGFAQVTNFLPASKRVYFVTMAFESHYSFLWNTLSHPDCFLKSVLAKSYFPVTC